MDLQWQYRKGKFLFPVGVADELVEWLHLRNTILKSCAFWQQISLLHFET